MGELRNCIYCQILYTDYINFPICQRCNPKLEKTIKDYVKEHENSSISDIVKDTGISEKIIKIYLKSKTIEYSDGTEFCKSPDCYNTVEEGKDLCPDCLKKLKLISALEDMYYETPKKPTIQNRSSGFHSSLGKRR